jgi:protein involved in polysaccharide export with SLBB domain
MSFAPAVWHRMMLAALVAANFLPSGLSQGTEAVQPAAPVKADPVTPAAPADITVSKSAAAPKSQNAEPLISPTQVFPSQSPAQSSPSVAVSGDYVLRPGDAIEMIIYKEQDLSVRTKIGKDGKVQLPLLGVVNLAGLTLSGATDLLTKRYDADYLVSPQIYLNILGYQTVKFTIIGQVGKPGTYEYSESEPLDLLQAVGMAGGFTRIADRGRVVVKRREGAHVRTVKVNAKKLTDSSVDRFPVENGDVINVGESWF